MEAAPLYKENFVRAKGLKLHYLDWGGSGQPLILIPGLGDTPYLFMDLAASLKDHFRVIAYSRRGHGKSETEDTHFDNATLVSDILLFLDGVDIEKASLLGWSMGGNEITEFAIRYPERTSKLIYFESGYDLSEPAFKELVHHNPVSPFPGSEDLRSLDAYREWYHHFWFPDVAWNAALEANLKASTHVNPNGSVTTIPDDRISSVIMESVTSYLRDYSRIQAPALALYTHRFLVPPVQDEDIVSAYARMEKDIIRPWRVSHMDRIRAQLKNVTVQEIPVGSHTSFLFLSKDAVVDAITSFLLAP